MLSDHLRTKPLREWTYEDFTSIKDAEESIGLELKSDLPLNKDARGWRTAGKLHKSERDGIAKEIVALANSYGGELLIGINESEDHPKRAAGPADKLLNVDKLVDELKRSLSALIDPPIAGLEIQAIKKQPKSLKAI